MGVGVEPRVFVRELMTRVKELGRSLGEERLPALVPAKSPPGCLLASPNRGMRCLRLRPAPGGLFVRAAGVCPGCLASSCLEGLQ